MSRQRDFWSRRKAGVQAETAALELESERAELALQDRPDEELLAELDLPAPEELESSEAVREFLKSALPERLKTRALRRLWRLNPVLANLDGLVDYGEDYTDAATVLEDMQTVYQVGKGMVSALLEEEPAEEPAEQEETSVEPVRMVETEPKQPPPVFAPEPPVVPEAEPVARVQRRMRFEFEEA